MGSGRTRVNRIRLRSRQMDNRERTFSRSSRYDLQGGGAGAGRSNGLGGNMRDGRRIAKTVVMGSAVQVAEAATQKQVLGFHI